MRRKLILALLVVLLLSLLVGSITYAQTGSGFDLSWNVLSGGGGSGTMTGDGYEATATIGQTAIGASTGTNITLGHGFWQGLIHSILSRLPVVLRNY